MSPILLVGWLTRKIIPICDKSTKLDMLTNVLRTIMDIGAMEIRPLVAIALQRILNWPNLALSSLKSM